jgi:hypothetical protein
VADSLQIRPAVNRLIEGHPPSSLCPRHTPSSAMNHGQQRDTVTRLAASQGPPRPRAQPSTRTFNGDRRRAIRESGTHARIRAHSHGRTAASQRHEVTLRQAAAHPISVYAAARTFHRRPSTRSDRRRSIRACDGQHPWRATIFLICRASSPWRVVAASTESTYR